MELVANDFKCSFCQRYEETFDNSVMGSKISKMSREWVLHNFSIYNLVSRFWIPLAFQNMTFIEGFSCYQSRRVLPWFLSQDNSCFGLSFFFFWTFRWPLGNLLLPQQWLCTCCPGRYYHLLPCPPIGRIQHACPSGLYLAYLPLRYFEHSGIVRCLYNAKKRSCYSEVHEVVNSIDVAL